MEKKWWMIIAIVAVIVIAIYLIAKPSLLGSPISCYVRCNQDDNCGANTLKSVCNGTNLCRTSTTFTCNNPGTSNSSCSKAISTGCTPCTYGCASGKCKSAPVNQTYTCTDSDGGVDFWVKGTTTEKLNNIVSSTGTDSCGGNMTATLTEYYCSANKLASTTYDCPESCSNGACVIANSTGNSTG